MDRYRDLGLLILRVGFGLSFFWYHGYPKLAGGPETWARIGDAVSNIGITFAHPAWGLAARCRRGSAACCLPPDCSSGQCAWPCWA